MLNVRREESTIGHIGDKKCDSWWEPETEWHRSWKSNFLDEWQELVLRDKQTGEKHIADVCTDYGLVIEKSRNLKFTCFILMVKILSYDNNAYI
jgi:hypothetical protein